MAAFNHPACDLTMHYDERGSAFMALGYGKAKGKPGVWITTSGTALANGFPAIVEADMESVPMILLTADRPPELRDSDANQTIRQDHIFGRTVRWFVDMPAPSDHIDPTFVLTTVDYAVSSARTGPVHMNCQFREPLAPTVEDYSPSQTHRFSVWENSDKPFTTYAAGPAVDQAAIDYLKQALAAAERPMIMLGRMNGDGALVREAAEQLCNQYKAVAFFDVTAAGRLGPSNSMAQSNEEAANGKSGPLQPSTPASGIVEPNPSGNHLFIAPDMMLTSHVSETLIPDVVIQFGATPVSKRLNQFLKSAQIQTYCVVDHRERRIDPGHVVSHRIAAEPHRLLEEWSRQPRLNSNASQIESRSDPGDVTSWQTSWQRVAQGYQASMAHLFKPNQLTEQAIARCVSQWVTSDYALTVGSSNPIRHVDSFAIGDGYNVPILSNRGASGIDGTVASGIGFAMAHGKRPLILLGDLALLHDLNSLLLCQAAQAIVVVINNDGGGIFSHLPVRNFTPSFEPLFGTPHGLVFEQAAALFGLTYEQPMGVSDLNAALSRANESKTSTLIEIRTDREKNRLEAERLREEVNAAILARLSPKHS